MLDDYRRLMQVALEDGRRTLPTEQGLALAEGYNAIDHAQLVIVNIRDEKVRPAASSSKMSWNG